jgi:cytochrome c biogenesis protein CcmG/thiol:disulfide interchange protein DsbE
MNKPLLFLTPLIIFTILIIYLASGLNRNPQIIPNSLQGMAVPIFSLPPIKGRDNIGFKNTHLPGTVSLINIFGSWCVACKSEHSFLMHIKAKNLIPIHGIDWRELDQLNGPRWLKIHGDPYTLVGDDPASKTAIAFGVTGAPETFLIDKKGIIQYKHIGPINKEVWDSTLWPMIQKLRQN